MLLCQYESRLLKYAARGFSVAVSGLADSLQFFDKEHLQNRPQRSLRGLALLLRRTLACPVTDPATWHSSWHAGYMVKMRARIRQQLLEGIQPAATGSDGDYGWLPVWGTLTADALDDFYAAHRTRFSMGGSKDVLLQKLV